MEDVQTVADAMGVYDRFLVGNGYVDMVQGWGSGIHYSATEKGRNNPVITDKLARTLHIRSEAYFERDFTQKARKEQFGVPKDQKVPAGYAIHFYDGKNGYSRAGDWRPGTYYVTKGYSILQTNIESHEAALRWAKEFAGQRRQAEKSDLCQDSLNMCTGADRITGAARKSTGRIILIPSVSVAVSLETG